MALCVPGDGDGTTDAVTGDSVVVETGVVPCDGDGTADAIAGAGVVETDVVPGDGDGATDVVTQPIDERIQRRHIRSDLRFWKAFHLSSVIPLLYRV